MHRRPLILALLSTGLFGLSAHAITEQATLSFDNAWIRAAPPVAKVMAGYGALHNTTREPLVIESLSSPAFERVELHEMSMTDGVMQMRRRDPYTLEPGATLELEPGGWHLMLINPKTPQPAGESVLVVIKTPTGGHGFVLPVKDTAP